MAITSTLTSSFKKELLEGVHNFKNSGGDTFKLALYTSSATLGATTTAFVTTGQASGTGYSTGGGTLTRVDPSIDGTTAITDFADLTFGTATITARGCLIYNSSDSNKSVAAIDFGGDKTSTAGDFTIVFPAAAASTAIIRIAQGESMALVLNDRVKETTTTTGTGTVNLAGAETGFETFVQGVGNSNTTYYAIVHTSAKRV